MATRAVKSRASVRAKQNAPARAKRSAGAPAARRAPVKAKRGAAATRVNARSAAPVSDEAVRGRTGRSWAEWMRVLDRARAREWSHAEIARHLASAHRVSSWWSQMITVGYERMLGRRVQNQRTDGWSISVSRTLEAPAAAVFRAFHDARRRARWLGATKFTIRTARAPRTLRVTWEDGRSHLLVTCTPKGAARCVVEVEHTRLASASAAARMKTRWAGLLGRLRESIAA
jgi:uncharacterized protein YndB with AHSA1/START domain